MSKILKFTNWTDEDFTHCWNKEEYTFKAGESTFLEDWKAHHFAKHLVTREINNIMDKKKNEKEKNYGDLKLRKELTDKCLSETENVKGNVETEVLNRNKGIENKDVLSPVPA